MNSTEPIFSVVVCTYNHASLLGGALETLCRQTMDPARYEIVVVDNNSTDDTGAVTEAFRRRRPGIRYCFEPVQGIAHARNTGWRQARGLYVGYLDDDCRAPDDWLGLADEIVQRLSPKVLGGPYQTAFDGAKPRWASDSFNSYIPFEQARSLAREEYWALVGGNVFFERAVFGMVGGFDPAFGHVGNTVCYGEETALFKKISERFPRSLYYDPRLGVKHIVRPEKLTLSYGVRSAFAAGRSAVRRHASVNKDSAGRLLVHAGLTTLSLLADVLVRMLVRDRRRYRYARNYVQHHSLDYVRRLGSLYEAGRVRPKPDSVVSVK